MLKTITIKIPFVYPSRNKIDSMHWAQRNMWIRKFKYDVMLFINRIPEFNFEKAKIKVILCFAKKRKRDLGNYEPKYLVDSLVDKGILKDDSKEVLSDIPEVEIRDNCEEEEMIVQIQGGYHYGKSKM